MVTVLFMKFQDGAYSYGKRIDQFIALRDALMEVFSVSTPSKFIAKDFYNAYIRLYAKFLMLICGANARQYVKHGLDIKPLQMHLVVRYGISLECQSMKVTRAS